MVRRETRRVTPPKVVSAAAVAVAVAGVAGFFMLRSTPLDEAVDAIEERGYFFDEDRGAEPGLSPTAATSMAASGQEPSIGPVAGFMTHDSRPTVRNDLEDQPVYLFVVDELQDPGPVLPGHEGGPAPHVVFVYAQGGAESAIAIPIED